MKVSEISLETVKDYLKVENDIEDGLIDNILTASKNYVKNYTGLTDAEIDTKEDITLVVLVLVNEMYSNREYTVDKNILNPVVTSILNMHSVNLL